MGEVIAILLWLVIAAFVLALIAIGVMVIVGLVGAVMVVVASWIAPRPPQ